MKMFSSYPGCQNFRSEFAENFQSLDKGRMWWKKILGDKEGSISCILQIYTINNGYV